MSNIVTFSVSVPTDDLINYGKFLQALGETGFAFTTSTNGDATATAAPQKRKAGRPKGSVAKAKAVAAPTEKRKPGRPKKVQSEAASTSGERNEEGYSTYKGAQKKNGRGKFYTADEVKKLQPIHNALVAAYRAAGGTKGGQSTKSWTIANLRKEVAALGGDASLEDSPSAPTSGAAPKKSKTAKINGRKRSKFAAAAAKQAATKKPRGRAAKAAKAAATDPS